ncbi:MAG: methylated-DNA--[protein]-cysteine S-methyltransferase [candidate division KSB1 bacterium]|nr:methylated-DNA--[protein]-cysteine S-methyltransferase [candidate division KSB1 bacterium]MDZ7356621.1 methylated-DNA--[protein]-cysteine S-methyltransferase [candidate division KSB1 bacterium]
MMIVDKPPAPSIHLKNAFYHSPIGWLKIACDDAAIVSVQFVDNEGEPSSQQPPLLQGCIAQLCDYFQGLRKNFELPLAPQGTAFQKLVWKKLLEIPFGTTASYGDIAHRIGEPRAVRAVGRANGQNPIAIIIPCHRVIGADGKLVGYGAGLWRKQWLLQHEQRMLI